MTASFPSGQQVNLSKTLSLVLILKYVHNIVLYETEWELSNVAMEYITHFQGEDPHIQSLYSLRKHQSYQYNV